MDKKNLDTKLVNLISSLSKYVEDVDKSQNINKEVSK
jgi:hypothetical protein